MAIKIFAGVWKHSHSVFSNMYLYPEVNNSMFTSSFVCPDQPRHKHLHTKTNKRGLVCLFWMSLRERSQKKKKSWGMARISLGALPCVAMSLSTSLHLGFDPFPPSQKKHSRCHWKMTLSTEAQTQLIVKPFTNQLAGYQRAKRCEIGISLKWIASRIQAVSVPKKTIMPDILYAACSSWLRKIQWLIQCLYTPS